MGKIFTNKKSWIFFFIVIIIYAILKLGSVNYSYSDENAYFYMGKLVSEGLIPYKDFFFSHPPLQIVLFAIMYKIAGFNFFLLKFSSTIAIIISAFFLFKLVKKIFDGIAPLISIILFLFSYDSLRFSSYPLGVDLATMFIVIGFYYLLAEKKIFLSGIFFGFAGITGIYSLIPALVIIIFLLIKGRKIFLKFLLGFSLIFAAINIIFLTISYNEFVTQAFKYHLMKPNDKENKIEIFLRIIEINFLLFLAAFSYFFFKDKKIQLVWIVSLAYILFLFLLKKIFSYYFMLAFPLLAVLGGFGIASIYNRGRINKNILLIFLAALLILTSAWGVNRYIKYDFQDFDNAEEIADYIKSNSAKEDTIFGDDSITPLIALLSDRRIALNFADSNSLRFRSGVTDINKVISELKKNNNKFVIDYKLKVENLIGRNGPSYMNEFSNYLDKECKIVKSFSQRLNQYERIVDVYDCLR